jgi:multidrug efflux pump subunit AcrA (membrane-fusion protein)
MKIRTTTKAFSGLAVAFVVVPLVALSSLHSWRTGSNALALSIVQVQQGALLSAVTATGTVQARRTVDVKYDTQSLITGLSVREGDKVVANQLVATMDLRLLEPALAQAQQTLQKDQSTLALAQASLHRAEALASAQVLAQADLDTARANHDSLLHQTEADRDAMTLAQEQIRRAELRSPIDGVVIALYVHKGEMLGSATAVAGLGPNGAVSKPTNTLMTIAEEGALEVDADVNAVDMGGVLVGQEAKFTIDAFQPEVFSGAVRSIALQPTVTSGVTTYRVVISIAHPDKQFRIGMPANVMLFRSAAKSAILLPPGAVLRNEGQPFVFVIDTPTQQNGDEPGDGTKPERHKPVEISVREIGVQVIGETSSAVAVRGDVNSRDWVLSTADPKLLGQSPLEKSLLPISFKPNPDLSDLQFERNPAAAGQRASSVPGPKPKGLLQRLFSP